jgi:hypothetical protein
VAGAAPLAALTAILCVDALDLSPSETVLIAGATGGVRSLALQLAGATVTRPRHCSKKRGGCPSFSAASYVPGAKLTRSMIALSLPQDEAYLRRVGADDVPSRDGDIVAAVRERHPEGVDAIGRWSHQHNGQRLSGDARSRRQAPWR